MRLPCLTAGIDSREACAFYILIFSPMINRLFTTLAAFLLCSSPLRADTIQIQGAVSTALAILDSAKVLQQERNLTLQISINGGSVGGIAALGSRTAEIALTSKPVSAEERAAYPDVLFTEIPIGYQTAVLAVSKDVWQEGVHTLTANQVRAIYEGKVRNWKEVGGADQKITIFMSEPGRGLWEMFAQWLYGEVKKAPGNHYQNLSTNEEIRNALEFTPGSVGLIQTPFADRHLLFPLGIKEGAEILEPRNEDVASGKYPLARKLSLVVNDKPTLNTKIVVDFALSKRGQAMVKKAAMLPISEVTAAAAK